MVPTERKAGDEGLDADTMGEIVATYGLPLRRFLARRVGEADAEEMVQELFLALHRRRGGEPILNPEGYLFSAARHLLARRRNVATVPVDFEWFDAEGATPETELASKQELESALRAIQNLPPRTRDAFILHRFEDMSYAMIAERMGISLSAVRQLISRALSHIAQEVGRPR